MYANSKVMRLVHREMMSAQKLNVKLRLCVSTIGDDESVCESEITTLAVNNLQ